jgi:heptaprenyl diphosphate synthase
LVEWGTRTVLAYRHGVARPNPLSDLSGMADNLDRVEKGLHEACQADDEFLTEVASHLLSAGGKRVRPAFCIAASMAGEVESGASSHEAVMGGVSVELVHLGSLYHDDVMDDAETRRTVDSVNARWGNLKAILAGDFLLARASEIAADLGTEVAGLLAATIARLCEGQVRELQDAFNVGRTEQAYLASIDGKTAALFAAACRIGGIVAERDRDEIDALTEFGHAYGMAFQVVDDVLDVVATDEQLGKPAGHDMVEGVYTLPVIRMLADGHDHLDDLLGSPLDERQRLEARSVVRNDGAIHSSLSTAREFLVRADAAIAPVGGGPAIEALTSAGNGLLGRVEELVATA